MKLQTMKLQLLQPHPHFCQKWSLAPRSVWEGMEWGSLWNKHQANLITFMQSFSLESPLPTLHQPSKFWQASAQEKSRSWYLLTCLPDLPGPDAGMDCGGFEARHPFQVPS